MSARTEQLLAEIVELEAKIVAEPTASPAVDVLREQLVTRRSELLKATQALNEGTRVLKG